MPFGIIGSIGSVVGGLFGKSSADKAAQQQAQAAREATAAQTQMYQTTRGDLMPWMSAGGNALNVLQSLLQMGQGGGSPVLAALGIGPGGQPGTATTPFQASPGYAFAKQQGLDAITNQTARRGGLGGNALKALTSYGTGVANQEYNNYLDQLSRAWQSLLGGVGGIASAGEDAAARVGNYGITTGQSIGSNIIGGGNALASGTIGGASALTSGINSAIQNLAQQYNSPGGLFGWGGGATANPYAPTAVDTGNFDLTGIA